MHTIPSNDLVLLPGAPVKSPAPVVTTPVVASPVDDPTLAIERLDASQQRVMELLLRGQSVTDAAKSANVGRTTIYRWMNHDPLFKAIYERWQQHLRRTNRARLVMMTDKAVNIVDNALEKNDVKVAMGVLRQLGVLGMKE